MRSVAAIYVTMATSIVLVTGSATVLPVATAEIGGAGVWTLALTLAGVISIVLMPVYGYLAARNPAIRMPIYVAANAIAAVVVMLRGTAPDIWTIILPGILLGLYSPATYVLGFSMIRDMFDKKQAGIYLGAVGTVQSIGMLVGPLFTGFMIAEFGWRSIHFILGPLFLLAAVLMWSGVRVSKAQARGMVSNSNPFDATGATFVLFFLASTVLFLSLGRYAPFGSPQSWALLVVAVATLGGLVFTIRQKGMRAFIPAPVLKDRNTVSLAAVNFFSIFSSMAVPIFMPLYLLQVLMVDATTTGAAISTTAIAGLVLSPIFGRMIGKAATARGVILWAGGAVRLAVLAGLLGLTLLPQPPLWGIFMLLLCVGIYSAASGVASAVGPQVQLAEAVRAQGNSIVQLGQNFGNSISIAVYTALVAAAGGPVLGVPVVLAVAIGATLIMMSFGARLQKLPDTAPNSRP